MADHIYLLPLTVESIVQILEEREIDAVLSTMGGQTALNLAIEAGKTIVIDQADVVEFANRHGITLVAVRDARLEEDSDDALSAEAA